MQYVDYYKTLGVSKNATQDEIKKAYKKLAVKYHPDKNQGNKDAELKFKEINEAYQALGEPDKRKRYDSLGANWDKFEQYDRTHSSGQRQNQYTANDLNEIFGNIFGNAGGRGRRKKAKTNFGGFSGAGGYSDFFETFFSDYNDSENAGYYDNSDIFSGFDGLNGSRVNKPVDSKTEISISLNEALTGCEKQYIINGQTIKVKIPAGIKSGQQIKLKGLGGGDYHKGDLYLKVNIELPAGYKIENDNLIMPLNITPYEAALGAEIFVNLPQGKIKVRIPECSSSGKRMRLTSKGFKNNAGGYHDIYLELKIIMPNSLTAEEKKLYERLAQGAV